MSSNENNNNNSNVNNLNSFQSKSRLHFIGSWTNEATGMIRKIFEQHPEYDHSAFFSEQQIVCHIDMDCFFVLVALSKPENAHLRGKPVAVASGGNMSEISSCSYKAREFGLRAGMWLHQAKKLCPELQLVKYDFDRVRVINNMVYKAAFECCPHGVHMKLQVVSVDEFFVAFDSKDFDVARIFCENLRRRIFEESNGCTASCGVAPNVHVARAVTDLAKPDGVKIVTSAECLAFVREMAVDSIHGVGRKMQEKIKEMCILEKIEPSGRKTVKQNNNVGNKYEDTSSSNDDDEDENAMMMLPARRERHENEENKQQPQQLAATVVVEKVILVKDLLPFSLDKLKKHLGNAMAEKLHNLAHKALDHTLVVGTGTSDSNLMPKAVGTSMNYAIRLNQIHEFSALLLQLCKDIASKLDRVGGAALIVKLSVLVRHPDAPIQTAKHLGCGWTNEFLLGQAKAISNEVAFVTAEKMHDTLMPFALGSLKVVAAKLNNTHNINNNDQGKGSRKNDDGDDDGEEGLLPLLDEGENDDGDDNNNSSAKPKPNYYWGPSKKVTMQQDSEPILITDLRGISLHASSIIPRPKAKISMTGKKIQAQMSIADSFRQIQQKTGKNNSETLERKKKSASTSSKPFTLSDDDDDEGDDDENDVLVIDDDVVEEGDESKIQREATVGGKHKHDNRNSKSKVLLLLSQTSNDSDDGIEILPQQKKNFNNKNANSARKDSSVILVGSQEDEEDDLDDVRRPEKNMSNNKIQISKRKTEPDALEQNDINDESRSPCVRVDRNSPLSQMALVLVALRNGKILNILESKDPINTDLRKLAARIVLDENTMPMGMQLLGGGNKRKFTAREIDAAKIVLGR